MKNVFVVPDQLLGIKGQLEKAQSEVELGNPEIGLDHINNALDTVYQLLGTLEKKENSKLFELGAVVSTPGALNACALEHLAQCLMRHVAGDWGTVCEEDAASNNEAVKDGFRILSAYPIDPRKPSKGHGKNTLWIITEADRSVTTFLLPEEY